MLFYWFLHQPIFSKPAVCNHGSNHSSKVTCHTECVINALSIGLVEHEVLRQIQHQHSFKKNVWFSLELIWGPSSDIAPIQLQPPPYTTPVPLPSVPPRLTSRARQAYSQGQAGSYLPGQIVLLLTFDAIVRKTFSKFCYQNGPSCSWKFREPVLPRK